MPEQDPHANVPANASNHDTAVDVLVIGAGMAGMLAALAAREEGRSVLIVEPGNVLGGQGTAGGVAGFCGDTARVNRPFAELVAVLQGHGHIAPLNPLADRRPYDLEWCAFELQEMVRRSGARVLLHAMVVDVTAEDGWIRTVRVATTDGLMEVKPGTVIDATGRCVAAVKAGFPTMQEGANRHLPMSLYFTLWDAGRPVEPFLPPGCPTWDSDDDLPMTTLHPFDTGKVEVKMKVIGYDAVDPFGLSEAEMQARRQMHGLIHYLQTRGYRGRRLDTHVLASVSRHIGVREERRIVGEYVLTEDDVSHACVFDDAVAVGTYHLDYHWPDRLQRAGTGVTTMLEPYQIPLRAMIPRGAKNLLVPGRGASGDQMAMSSFRVMATVAQMGYASGLAAAVAVETRASVGDVPIGPLRQRIEAGGQSLNLSDYGDYLRQLIVVDEPVFIDPPHPQCHASTLVEMRDHAILAAWFGGTHEKHPDVAIWGAVRRRARWSKPRVLARVADLAHWNPVLHAEPDGTIHLWFKVGPSVPEWETWRVVSRDGGETWSDPERLPNLGAQQRGPVKNKPLRLASGALLAGASTELAEGHHTWRAYVDRSDNGGATWSCGEIIPMSPDLPEGAGVIQPAMWESQPGRVHMLLRSNVGVVCRSDSEDDGRTWSAVRPTDLPNNNSGLDVTRLRTGELAMVFNPVGANWGARSPLTLALSTDNGLTWPRRLDLATGEGEFSYPAVIPTAGGMAITYTNCRRGISFWKGSVEQIPEAAAL